MAFLAALAAYAGLAFFDWRTGNQSVQLRVRLLFKFDEFANSL